MKSYIKTPKDLLSFFGEYVLLIKSLKKRAADAQGEVQRIILDYENVAKLIGRDISKCDLLEIGSGQIPLRQAFFASKAKSAMGVDLDVIATKYNLIEFIRMIRFNGFTRTVRTFGRQLLGLNENLMSEYCRQMGFSKFPDLNIIQGNVCEGLKLKEASFDVIVSTNVFEHLADPETALKEMARLLRPGGVVLTLTCHWGQANAIHDLEAMYGLKPARWAHLRPSLLGEVKQHAYVNDLRMKDWEALFARYFDNTTVSGIPWGDAAAVQKQLELARHAGDLVGFTDSELLSETCLIRSVAAAER